jgi:hypothetical protein
MELQPRPVSDTRPEAANLLSVGHASHPRAPVYRASGAAPDPRSLPDHRVSPHNIQQLPTVNFAMGRRSKVEQIVLISERLSVQRGELLSTLLATSNPATSGGRPVLRPLWANETMHRAYSLVALTHLLDRHCPQRLCTPVGQSLEHKNVMALSQAYSALQIADDNEWLACSDLLRTIARGLVELFGPAIGQLAITTNLPQLSLPAFKRRALVLACNELVVNSLRHAFLGRLHGSIVVSLTRADRRHIRLSVADNGVGTRTSPAVDRFGIAADLALLLEGDLGYRDSGTSGTVAEISFPAVMHPKVSRRGIFPVVRVRNGARCRANNRCGKMGPPQSAWGPARSV